jgi:surface polysaccharide O-acyltransferase-like enzyme
MKKNYIDYLRIVAIIAAITIHVTADYYTKFSMIKNIDWWFANLLNSASRFAVPLFVMISGAVLIGKKYEPVEFYSKRVRRLLPAIIFWNIFYVGFSFCKGMSINSLIWQLKIGLLASGKAYYHLWYLSMFACLMLFVPYINKLLTGEKLNYNDFKILSLLFLFFFTLNGISSILMSIKGIKMNWFKSFPWFIAYFVAGHFLDKHKELLTLSVKNIFFALTLLITFGATINFYYANHLGLFKDNLFLNSAGPFVFLITIIIFQLARLAFQDVNENKIIAKIAECTFGIYLIHPVFLYFFKKLLPSYDTRGVFYIPLVIVLTFFISFFTIATLRRFSFFKSIC